MAIRMVLREGRRVWSTPRVDYDKKLALKKIYAVHGRKNVSNVLFYPLRKDGTRGVFFKYKGEKSSYSYLTDIGRRP